MGFLQHLDELRKRLIHACVGIAIGMAIAFVFIGHLIDFVLAPARKMLPPGSHFIFTQPAEAFSLYVTVALIAGAILAGPYVAYQVWLFIAPALYAKEKRFAIPFVLLTSIGGLSGAAFGHYVLFPAMMAFFGTFSSTDIQFLPRLEDTFSLYLRTLGGMVLVFQIPTLIFFLAKMQLVTARFLWRNIKYAVLISFVVAAILTPSPDPWNQTIFAGPMIGLYLISIGIAWLVRPRGQKETTDADVTKLRLVIGVTVADQAMRQRKRRISRRAFRSTPSQLLDDRP
jgi:sec-independent protein translocase protein TatC